MPYTSPKVTTCNKGSQTGQVNPLFLQGPLVSSRKLLSDLRKKVQFRSYLGRLMDKNFSALGSHYPQTPLWPPIHSFIQMTLMICLADYGLITLISVTKREFYILLTVACTSVLCFKSTRTIIMNYPICCIPVSNSWFRHTCSCYWLYVTIKMNWCVACGLMELHYLLIV